MENDVGAEAGARAGFDVEPRLAVASPHKGFVCASLKAHDLDQVRDHERGIETDAELADEVRCLALVFAEALEEGPCP